MTEQIPELETKYHSDVTKKLYTEARRNISAKAIDYTLNQITTQAAKGTANVYIDLTTYPRDIPTVAEYLTSEYYNITILKKSIIVNLDSNKSIPLKNIKLNVKTDINYTASIFGIGLPTYGLFLMAFLLIGVCVFGEIKTETPPWPVWYKLTLLYVPFIFAAISHILYNYAKFKQTTLIFENNTDAMKWYLYETEVSSIYKIYQMDSNGITK